MDAQKGSHSKEYLTVLLRRRSAVALCCVVLTLMLAFFGVIEGVNRTTTVLKENGFASFVYYTMFSNTFAALAVAFAFPFTVEGIRNKRFILPKWVALMHYLAATSIAITMVFVLAFMSWASPENAFGGANFVTHIICPALILITFFQMENGHVYVWKDWLIGIVPFSIYLVVYLIEVFVIGESNGGWPDIYQIQEFASPALAVPALLLLAFAVSAAIALFSNRLTNRRKAKMYRLWQEDMDPIEVRIEAYGIGQMAGRSSEKNIILIPYDILKYLADRYHLKIEDLMNPFITGLLIELKERNREEPMRRT